MVAALRIRLEAHIATPQSKHSQPSNGVLNPTQEALNGPPPSMILLLIVVIGLFQILYFKISYVLREGGGFDFFGAVFGSDGLFNMAVTAIVVFLHLGVVRILRQVFGETQVKTRYILQFIISGIFAAIGAGLSNWFYSTVIYHFGMPTGAALFNIAVLAFIIPIILTGLLETFYYRGQWQREQYLQEQTKRQMVSAKFEALKNQLSPHFVFNSFNTLGAIIGEDPSRAQEFLAQLSTVYRYILDNKDKETVSLGREIDCLKALLHVQEDRHPDAVNIEINISEQQRSLRIIPLTLHTLVENVFKHNVLSKVTPINMKIEVRDNDSLIVENDLRPKLDVESHNIGIENLSRRYELLIHKGLSIMHSKSVFQVEIPFIGAEARI
jgi:histidine kinase